MTGMSPSISPCTGSSSGGGGKRRKSGVGGKEKKEKKEKKQKKQKKAKDAEDNGGAGKAAVSTQPPPAAAALVPVVAPVAPHALAGGPAAAAAAALTAAAAAASRQPALQAAAAEGLDEDDEEDEDEEDPGADRMRQALKALRQRREQLDDVQAELETSKAEVQRLKGELGEATSSSAASSVQLQGQLSTAKAELEGAQKARAAAASEVEALQGQLAEARMSRAEEAKALQIARSELVVVRDAKVLLSQEADSLRAQLARATAEAEEARKARAATAEEAAAVKSQLAKAHSERDEAQRALVEAQKASLEARTAQLDLSTKLEQERKTSEALRTQLGEAVKLRIAAADDARAVRSELQQTRSSGSTALGAAQLELQGAWELLKPGLDRLRLAMNAAGVRPTGMGAASAVPIRDIDVPVREAPEAARGSRRSSGTKRPPEADAAEDTARRRADGKREREEKKEKGQKKDKKEKKAKKEAREGKHAREQAADSASGRRAVPAGSPAEEVNTTSAESEEEQNGRAARMPHRTHAPSRSALKSKRSKAKGRRSSAHFAFADEQEEGELVETVIVRSYRDEAEALWFNNPQAHVLCERCQRRVPQKQGSLRGGSGVSSFMCDAFLCNQCEADND